MQRVMDPAWSNDLLALSANLAGLSSLVQSCAGDLLLISDACTDLVSSCSDGPLG